MLEKTKATQDMFEELGLTKQEYNEIVSILQRKPNDVELAMFATMWSEHCSYKSSKPYLKELPTKSHAVVVPPGENAGVIDIGDGIYVALRIESHNHPSAIEPYQGAATGVGGILRDIFTVGARPIAILDPLYVGPLTDPKNALLLEGVVSGISNYGNSVGVPTVGGELKINPCYSQNPLVNVMAVGILKEQNLVLSIAETDMAYVVLLGATTGRDGIGGVSTLASSSFELENEEAIKKLPSVQVGDPYEEKRLMEACLEMFEKRSVLAIQDLGGGGLTCACSEISAKSGRSIEIYVNEVPLREQGLLPFEIMTSESQERMLAIVERAKLEEVIEIAQKWEINASVIGRLFKDISHPSLYVKTSQNSGIIAKVPAESLTRGPSNFKREVKEKTILLAKKPVQELPPADAIKNLLLSSIVDKSWIYTQYDHQLFLNTIVGPGSDCLVLRAGAPGIKATKSIAISTDGNPSWVGIDPYYGTYLTLVDSVSNITTKGATPVCVVDCLNFGSPEDPDVMWEFSQAINGLKDACLELEIPVVGGNVSFYNKTNSQNILPTPVIATLGLINSIYDPEKYPRPKNEMAVILLGQSALSGEALLGAFKGLTQPEALPRLNISELKKTLEFVRGLFKDKTALFSEVASVKDGGIISSIIKLCHRLGLGFTHETDFGLRDLLCPLPGRFLVITHSPEKIMDRANAGNVSAIALGRLGGHRLEFSQSFEINLGELSKYLKLKLEY